MYHIGDLEINLATYSNQDRLRTRRDWSNIECDTSDDCDLWRASSREPNNHNVTGINSDLGVQRDYLPILTR
jgi:hypothetical protein